MEQQFVPEILEIAEPLREEKQEAPSAEENNFSYSCGRCPGPDQPDVPTL